MLGQDDGKKFWEEVDLEYFLEAYVYVTGEKLCTARRTESPDFICIRETGEELGIELTKVMRTPQLAQAELLTTSKEWAEGDETFDRLWWLGATKEEKRKKSNWQVAEACLLVFQLMDCPLDEFAQYVDKSLCADFQSWGWKEVWAADFTEVEPYGEVWLFGLHPEKWWGPYPGPSAGTKPYG